MHDPSTLAFSIKIPLPWKRKAWPKGVEWASYHLADIWHEDPCKGPGGDDSCGWFMRAHHGNQKVLEKIVKRFDDDWDRVFKSDSSGKVYHLGYFHPQEDGAGMPNMTVNAIVINLFFLAACEHFNVDGRSNWKTSRRWMQDNLFDILLFAENPTDSLRDSIVKKWGDNDKREERIRSIACCIYGWILRETRPWYKHPRWHVHHWHIVIHFLLQFKRWAFSRCCKCGKRFKWGYSPCSNSWDSEGPRWFKSERNVYHSACDCTSKPQVVQPVK